MNLWAALAPPNGYLPVKTGGEWFWVEADDRSRFKRLAGSADALVCPVPQLRPKAWTLAGSPSVLWTRCETPKAARALAAFEPKPTVSYEDDEGWTALWALDKPLGWSWAVQGCRRIARALGTTQKHVQPGFHFKLGREVGLWELYTARQVVGHLPEAPDRDAWRRRG